MFTVDVDGRQYLVTAKPIIEGAPDAFTVDVFHDGAWKSLDLETTGHATDCDVSVFAAKQILSPTDLKAEASSADSIYGQDMFFLGFPFGLFGDFASVNHGFPLPFVKKATLSMIDATREKVLFLDGINNSGFSGGPVAYKVGFTNEWRIADVVSGYVTAEEQIALNNQDVGLTYAANTGLIRATPIKEARGLITANSNGFEHPAATDTERLENLR